MTRQARSHASPGTRKSVLFLRKGGKHKPPEIRQLTGIPERTQRDWVAAAKASGDWDGISLKAAPRKKRSDAGVGRKLTRRMIAAVKKRLLNNPRLTVNELKEKVPGLSGVSRERVQWAILHKIGLPARVAKKKPLDEINCSFQFVDFVNFIGNFQRSITQPNLAQFAKSLVVLNFSLPVLLDSCIGS